MFDNLFANYKNLAQRLGLQVEQSVGGFCVSGILEGVPVQTTFGTHAVNVAARWSPPSPMGLSLVPRTLLTRLTDMFRSGHAALGDAAFDKIYSVKADDIAHLASRLSPDARASLLDLAERGMHPSVDDHEVRLWRYTDSALWDREETIENDFRAAVQLARTLSTSFSR